MPQERIDIETIKGRLSIEAVLDAYLGTSGKGPGRRGKRLCPFHDDHDPSLNADEKKGRFKCYACGASGDSIEFIMELKSMSFIEAARELEALAGGAAPASAPRPVNAPGKSRASLSRESAEHWALEAAQALWRPRGRHALQYLRSERGLSDETIRRHRLGYVAEMAAPTRDGGTWPLRNGVSVPWSDAGRLVKLSVRRLGDIHGPRYVHVFTDGPLCYPCPEAIVPGRPLVLCEGELDALVLGQVLAAWAGMATCGSSSAPVPEAVKARSLLCWPRFAAHDRDRAGDEAAALWPGARRLLPPEGCVDWTEAAQKGVDLEYYLGNGVSEYMDHLEREGIALYGGG